MMDPAEEMKIGRGARLISGAGFPPSHQGRDSGAYPFLKVSDLSDITSGYRITGARNWVDRETLQTLGARMAPPGSIVFPKVGAALLKNPRRLLTMPAAMDNNLMAIAPMAGDERFWLYGLSTIDLGEISGSGPIPYVNEGQVRDLMIPFPALGEQRRIADFLDTETIRIDRLTKLRKRQLDAIKERHEAEYLRAIQELGSDWVQLRRLGATVATGPFGTQFSADDYQVNGIPMINTAHIQGGELTPDPRHAVSEETANRLSRHRLMPGDIIIARKRHLGRAATVRASQAGWLCGSDSIVLKVPRKNAHPDFIGHLLRSSYIRSQLLKNSLAATIPNLNEGNLLELEVPRVPLEDQREFCTQVSRVDKILVDTSAAMSRQVNLLAERRQALITAAVTGQFDVSTASGRNVTDGVPT